jgi:beta-glucosidase
MAEIDRAVHGILMAKYRLGLFEHPYAAPGKDKVEILSAAQHEAARTAAERSAVLLRNEGNLLPLKKSIHSLAVIGPLADSKTDIMGSWSLNGKAADSITVVQGLKNKLGDSVTIQATRGVEIKRGTESIFDDQFAPEANTIPDNDAARSSEFNHAIDLVKQSDAAVLVLGEAQNMSGERASRQTLTLPGEQQKLLQAAVATGKPVVLVLMNGRPLDITWAATHVPAILETWYPGTEGGNAIADLLFGDANPGGKLPVTWPRSVGQVPTYYAQNLTQIPEDTTGRYWDGSSAPLYPFGYGLSYSTFTLGNLRTDGSAMRPTGEMKVMIDVTNTSTVPGDEVVQLYTHQISGSASRPRRELKGFERVHLDAGEKRTVTLTLKASELGFWSPQTHAWAVEPGKFDLWAGDTSAATEHTGFEVLR